MLGPPHRSTVDPTFAVPPVGVGMGGKLCWFSSPQWRLGSDGDHHVFISNCWGLHRWYPCSSIAGRGPPISHVGMSSPLSHQGQQHLNDRCWTRSTGREKVILLCCPWVDGRGQQLVTRVWLFNIYIYMVPSSVSPPPPWVGCAGSTPFPFYLQATGSISEVQPRIC